MNGWFNPDSWMDIFDHFLLVVGALSVATVPTWFSVRNHKGIKKINDQVSNGHKTIFRDDFDEVAKMVKEIRGGVSDLRNELLYEAELRRENDRELWREITALKKSKH